MHFSKDQSTTEHLPFSSPQPIFNSLAPRLQGSRTQTRSAQNKITRATNALCNPMISFSSTCLPDQNIKVHSTNTFAPVTMPPTSPTYLSKSVHSRNRTKSSNTVDDKYNFSSDFSPPTDMHRKLSIDFSARVQRILSHARSYTSLGQHKLRSKLSTTRFIAGPEYVQSPLPSPLFRAPPPALCTASLPTCTKDTEERTQTYRRNSRKLFPSHIRSGSVLGVSSVIEKIVTPPRPSRPAGKDLPFAYDSQRSETQEEWEQQKPNQDISMVEGRSSPPARSVTNLHGGSLRRTQERSYKPLKQLNDAPIPPFVKPQSTAHMPGSTSRHHHSLSKNPSNALRPIPESGTTNSWFYSQDQTPPKTPGTAGSSSKQIPIYPSNPQNLDLLSILPQPIRAIPNHGKFAFNTTGRSLQERLSRGDGLDTWWASFDEQEKMTVKEIFETLTALFDSTYPCLIPRGVDERGETFIPGP